MKNLHQTPQCLDTETILRYLNAQTDKAETRRVELHVSECELCGDAVEGLMLVGNNAIIKEDIGRIEQNITHKYPTVSPTKPASFQIWQIAAAACILIVLGVSFFFYFPKNDKANQEMATEEKLETFDTNAIAKTETSQTDSLVADYNVLKNKENRPIAQVEMPTMSKTEEYAPNQAQKLENQNLDRDKATKYVATEPAKDDAKSESNSAAEKPVTFSPTPKPMPASPSKIVSVDGKKGESAPVTTGKKQMNPPIPSKEKDKPIKQPVPPSPVATAPTQASVIAEEEKAESYKNLSNSSKEDVDADGVADLFDEEAKRADYLSQGKSLMKKHKYQEAIEVLSQYSSDDKQYEDAQLQIAKCYLKLKQKTNANLVLDNIVSRNRKNVDAAKKMKKEGK